MSRVTNVIKAIHDVDLVRVLRRLGLYDALTRGELVCSICGRKLTLDSLGGVYKEGKSVKLVCDRIECLAEVARRVSLAKQLARK